MNITNLSSITYASLKSNGYLQMYNLSMSIMQVKAILYHVREIYVQFTMSERITYKRCETLGENFNQDEVKIKIQQYNIYIKTEQEFGYLYTVLRHDSPFSTKRSMIYRIKVSLPV